MMEGISSSLFKEQQAALDQGQIAVFLQPKINLGTDCACGAEALARWCHPVKGTLLPKDFLHLFSESGLIVNLDYYVCEKSCQILHNWKEKNKLFFPISVNISQQSLYKPDIVDSLVKLLAKYEILPPYLQLEITEAPYFARHDLVKETIEKLHTAGFSVIMDNFGSGYSSLNMLKHLKCDALKLDMRYLPIKNTTENDEIMLVSLIKMANWMGMKVIAEAVEERRQRDFLEAAGCDCAQGYYFAEALPQDEFEAEYILKTDISASVEIINTDEPAPKYNMTVLVIDDEELSRDLLRSIFRGIYHIHTCVSAEEGIVYLKRNQGKVKLILIDNFMPGMSGLEFLRYCKMDKTLAVIPQIMITTSDDEEDQLKAFQNGAYDYITKPFTKEIVMARVTHVMEISCRTSIFDIIEQKYKQQPELDAATSLLNKMAFEDLASRVLDTFSLEKQALLVIDIDDFKLINDRYGHLAGDKVIKCIADELTGAFRKTDVVGRFGGDEFVVLMTKLHGKEAAKMKAAEIIKTIMFNCTKLHSIRTSISVGLAFSNEEDNYEELFAKADKALYEAKRTGKGKAVVFGETIPPVTSDDAPVVVLMSKDIQVYSTIALTYGEGAAFVLTKNYEELTNAFAKYGKRICVVCLDMMDRIFDVSDQVYQYILSRNEERKVLILPICQEGDMKSLRKALELNAHDVLMMPPQMGVLERILSRTIMEANGSK